MEIPALSPNTGRSSSLPTSTAKFRSMLYEAGPRRDSDVMLINGPITPPLSPGHSDELDEDATVEYEEQQPYHASGLDSSISPSQPVIHVVHHSVHGTDRDVYMETEERDFQQPSLTPPRPPSRRLDNEQEHLHPTLKLTDFEVKGTLGTGTFGRVLLVKLRLNHGSRFSNFFAMKVLRKTEIIRLRQVEHVKAERNILSRVRHPFIVDLCATFQDNLNIYMLLSYVPGGELFTHLRRTGRFTADVTRFYLATIVLALRYLHSFNIIYRDLKPENLLLDSRGYLRLTDFGSRKSWTISDGHGKPADWWACGILAYEMMVGYPPFFDENAYGIYEKILRGKVHWPRDMDTLSRELIKGFLHPDRSKRLGNLINGSQDVLDHAWFRGVDWDALERREIRAPIVPHVTSVDDMRYFTRLPLPPPDEVPGLVRDEYSPPPHQGFDVVGFQFTEF
ncbi:hypothetical protein EW146_g6630 [Bondarzewia mesenterica]|uniref:cAMP-dependent protein kinase n=1 Tax=Bondarzewia mesenterica TaxID=1095465 RepID=A0A4S4LN05_9AGAM|nr:hypothetical protein EW146_g6630 [Bondarzewia mesenterica]